MKDLKDWSKEITDLDSMGQEETLSLYSEMLAAAHDMGYKVPDEQLIETESALELKKVIPALHAGITKHHAAAKVADEKKAKAAAKPPKPIKKTAAKPALKEDSPKKPAKTAKQKDAKVEEDSTMAKTATAKKATAKKAAPKKAAKAAKGAAKKAASGNARTPVARSSFAPDAKISVTFPKGEIPAREGSGVYDRLANLKKFDGKTVKAFLDSSLGRSSTLSYSVKEGWAKVK